MWSSALDSARLKKWSDGELKEFLTVGIYSDGDVPAAAMAEVITNTTSQITPADLATHPTHRGSFRSPVIDLRPGHE